MLDHKELETLIAIIDNQSFDKAAHSLNISPGAVSQRIKSMENKLGHSVLVRSAPPSATDVGEQVLSYARRMMLIHNEMNLALNQGHNTGSITLSIAVNHDSLSCWFMEVIKNVSQNPHVSFDIRTTDTKSTQALLISGEVIAAITSKKNQIAGCKTRYLGRLEYSPVCSPSFFDTHFQPNITPERIATAPKVIFDHSDDLIERYLTELGVTPKGKLHFFPSSHTLLDAVKQDIGWTLLPTLFIKQQLQDAELLPLTQHKLYVDLYWNSWEQVSQVVDRLEKEVLSVTKRRLKS